MTRPPLLVLVTVAVSLAMGALFTARVAGGGLDAVSSAWEVATVFEFAAFAGAALILSADRSSTRRLGTACGVAVGSLLYLPQLLQSLDPTRGASGGVGLFGDGPALLIPLFLGIVAGWIGRSGSAVIRTSLSGSVSGRRNPNLCLRLRTNSMA